MTFMIKMRYILIFFFLYSCQSIPYSQFPIIIKSSIYGAEDIAINDSLLAEKKFSFINGHFLKNQTGDTFLQFTCDVNQLFINQSHRTLHHIDHLPPTTPNTSFNAIMLRFIN